MFSASLEHCRAVIDGDRRDRDRDGRDLDRRDGDGEDGDKRDRDGRDGDKETESEAEK